MNVDPAAVADLVGKEIRIPVLNELLDSDGMPLAVDAYELVGIFTGLAGEDAR